MTGIHGGFHMVGGNWGGGWMWLGGIWMVLFWVLLILAIVALVRWIWGRGGGAMARPSAVEILKERYARGEIDREEFEQKRRDLEGS